MIAGGIKAAVGSCLKIASDGGGEDGKRVVNHTPRRDKVGDGDDERRSGKFLEYVFNIFMGCVWE